MQTFNEKLRQHKEQYETMEYRYKKVSMPEVKTYNLQYRKETGKYPYNADIEKYILEREKVDSDLVDHLGMEIYLSQGDIRKDEQKAQDEKMIAEGWIPIPLAPQKCLYRGKAIIKASKDIDWITNTIEKEGKIIDTNCGKGSFFIPKGNRTRGYYLELLKGYYKPIK